MKQAIAIQHTPIETLGSLEPVLAHQGYTVTYLNSPDIDLRQVDPLAPDLLVVLGGTMGVYEADQYPFLNQELHLLETRLQADLPTLGICLGAQLMARALGARVYPGTAGLEIGWKTIALTPAGQASPLHHLTPARTRVLHWHGDTFDLPMGAIHLASSDQYAQQAFQWGQQGLAVQFHPEVTRSELSLWFQNYGDGVEQLAQLQTDTACYGATLEQQATQFWHAWLNGQTPSSPHPESSTV